MIKVKIKSYKVKSSSELTMHERMLIVSKHSQKLTKINRLNDKLEAYSLNIRKICNKYAMELPQDEYHIQQLQGLFASFYSPFNFYLNSGNDICTRMYHNNKELLVFNHENFDQAFRGKGFFPPTIELVNALYAILKEGKKYAIFWRILGFRQKIDYDLKHLMSCLYLYDNNLCILDPYKGSIESIVTSDTYKKTIFKGRKPPSISDFLHIAQGRKQEIILEDTSKILNKRYPWQQMLFNDLIVLNLKGKHDAFVEYFSIPKQLKNDKIPIHRGEYIYIDNHAEFLMSILNKGVPTGVVKMLHQLFKADLDKVKQLASMLATINQAKPYNNKYVDVSIKDGREPNSWDEIKTVKEYLSEKKIYSIKKTALAPLYFLLEKLYEPKLINGAESKNMYGYENFEYLIRMQQHGTLAHVIAVPEKTRLLTSDFYNYLKKMCEYSTIKIKTKKDHDTLHYTNYAVIFLAHIEGDASLSMHEVNLGKMLAPVDFNFSIEDVAALELSTEDLLWLHLVLAGYGLVIDNDRKKIVNPRTLFDAEFIAEAFVKNVCDIVEDGKEYTEDIYNAFVRFFKANFDGHPMTQAALKKQLKTIYKLKDIRPRTSAKDNRRGLAGITVNKNRLEAFMKDISTGARRALKYKLANASYKRINYEVRKLIMPQETNPFKNRSSRK